jgi:hypothetical protein
MIDWGKLSPPEGWRKVWWELGIVTLGVLVALVAEQAVSSWRRQAEVRSFRSAINEELGTNLAAFDFRLAQGTCVANRLAELRRLRDQGLEGSPTAVRSEIGRPTVATMQTSVWSARDTEVMGAMPLDLRLAYSALYDELIMNSEQIAQEREAWRSMARFNGLRRMSEDDIRILSELLFRAESIDVVLGLNKRLIAEKADRLGIRPSAELRRQLGAADQTLCKPLPIERKGREG